MNESMGKPNKRPARPKGSLFLIGPMGAGKTTIGLQLAKSLKREFYDSDKVIEARTGAAIPLIFELEGEEGFRKREIAAINDLTQLPNIVLATGGGAVLREENRQALTSRGTVIYLKANLDQLVKRTSKDRNRPLLQTENPRARLAQILAEREPLYESTAHIVVETGNQNVRSIVHTILERMKTRETALQTN